MKQKQVLRVCSRCKEKFDVLTDDYVKVNKRNMHTQCYIDLQLNKGLSIDYVKSSVLELKELMNIEKQHKEKLEIEKQAKKLYAQKTQVNRNIDRKLFFDYVSEKYGVSTFPKHFFMKMSAINNGTHPSVNKCIPYDDLLDMFKRQEHYLAGIHLNLSSVNKELSGINKLNYDLAVIVNMYDKYLEWKQKQAVLQATRDIVNKTSKETNVNVKKVYKRNNNENNNDISDILNDLY